MDADTRDARPRAFYPDGVGARPARTRTPGWDVGPERRIDDGGTLARGLAWFSIGLGLVQIGAPRQVTRFLGLDEGQENLVRLFGAREIAHGVAILSQRTPAAGVWSRVGGDALDLAALGLALTRGRPRAERVGLAMVMVGGVAALDMIAARKLTGRGRSNGAGAAGGAGRDA